MNKKVIMFVIAGLMLCSAGHGQVVVTGDDGEVIIDCSGMKPSSYMATPKPRTATGTDLADDLSSSMNNAKVSKRFEVSITEDKRLESWSVAMALCAGKSGGNWRLPTQREIVLMWVLKPELEKVSGFEKFSGTYWSATKYYKFPEGNIWCMSFFYGSPSTQPQNGLGFIRCVRDL